MRFAVTVVSISCIACITVSMPVIAADAWPIRPIRLVVATTAGGSPDTIARMVGRAAEPYLGQSFVVDNRGGANGIIGATIVATAAPDATPCYTPHPPCC